ncbi:MAG TPA: ABC transporter ATP-binding protein [Albitalea sp.]|nr:ABC transporter ATP-binding protein [Albitalea sp.]
MSIDLLDRPPAATPPDVAPILERIAARRDNPAMPIVAVKDARKTYRLGHTEVQALRGVSVEVKRAELLAICGPSGSGKTTLLNLIGLIDRPSAGRVSLNGQSVEGLSHNALALARSRSIGFIFQNFNLLPVLTAYENVLLPLQLRGRVGKAEREKARSLLAEVGLAAQANARPDRMSGGQRQRVAIARALVTDPQLVIADEPTANLDSDTSHKVMGLIHELNRSHGVTFVFSTHDSRVIDQVHRCVWLHDGQIKTL